jgi:hypothetical protein
MSSGSTWFFNHKFVKNSFPRLILTAPISDVRIKSFQKGAVGLANRVGSTPVENVLSFSDLFLTMFCFWQFYQRKICHTPPIKRSLRYQTPQCSWHCGWLFTLDCQNPQGQNTAAPPCMIMTSGRFLRTIWWTRGCNCQQKFGLWISYWKLKYNIWIKKKKKKKHRWKEARCGSTLFSSSSFCFCLKPVWWIGGRNSDGECTQENR